MMIDDQPATQGEAYREMVSNIGMDNPDHCWILTPYDTWERNPAYAGPEQPHPEDDCRPSPAEEFVKLVKETWQAEQNPVDNNIPF